MKAEHRKELHTNALATYLGKSFDKAKSGSSVVWGGLLLVIALGVAYWWWTGVAANRASDAWTSYYNNRDSAEGLNSVSTRLKGTAADNAAKLALADRLYEDGYEVFFRRSRTEAKKNFDDAFAIYEELAKSSGVTEIGLRALIGAAKCQESIGEIERARYYYEEVVTRFEKALRTKSGEQHPLVAEAERRAKDLKDGDGVAFYGKEGEKRWPHRLPTEELPKFPTGGAISKPSGP